MEHEIEYTHPHRGEQMTGYCVCGHRLLPAGFYGSQLTAEARIEREFEAHRG